MQSTTGERNVEFSEQKLDEFTETEILPEKQPENQSEDTTNLPKTTQTTKPVTQQHIGCGGTYFEGSGSVDIPGFPGAYKKHQYGALIV